MRKCIRRSLVLGMSTLAIGCKPVPPDPLSRVEVRKYADGGRAVMHKRDGLLDGRTVLYAPAGYIKAIQHFRHDTLQGVQYTFYPTGRPLTWEQAQGGRLRGNSYGFYQNGTVAFTRTMVNDQRSGPYRLYYERPHRLHVAIDFVIVNGKEYQNQYVAYDSLGRLTERSAQLTLQAASDTIALGDSLALHLRVLHPEHPQVAAVTGDFDEEFRLHDPASLHRQMGRNHALTIHILAVRRGQQVVRGYLADFQESPQRSSSQRPDSGQRLYFAYRYFVK